MRRIFLNLAGLLLALMSLCAPLSAHAATAQSLYATPEAAVDALVAALKSEDEKALVPVFGEVGLEVLSNPDRSEAAINRKKFLAGYDDYHRLNEFDGKRVLAVGKEAWLFPIPLVKEGSGWRFAVEEGLEEILNRRIGANELNAIAVLRAFPAAEREYATIDHDGDGVLEFAGRLASSPGKRDGLYWASQGEGDISPFGPLVAEASEYLKGRSPGQSYHGYFFRILTKQGGNAAGGAYDYVINGRLLGGVALLAWPERYGDSGVMTFMVNQNGVLYQKDLGEKTADAAKAIDRFDPGKDWAVVSTNDEEE